MRLVERLSRIQDKGLPLEDRVVLAQTKECLRELLASPALSDMVFERLRSGTVPVDWPGSPTSRTRDVLRSLSDSGKSEFIRQLLAKATRVSERAVIESALREEFGPYFPEG